MVGGVGGASSAVQGDCALGVLEEKAQQYMVKISSVESLHAVVTCLTDCAIQISSVVQGENLLFGVMACCGYLSD